MDAKKFDAETVEYLRDLVKALDNAFISSWQSTSAWQAQLDAARDYLDRIGAPA